MDKKKEIIGILLILVSIFMMLSLITYNSSEEPTISPNIAISNRAGIIGVYISYFFRKLGIGYISFIIPILGIVWGWILFSKKNQKFFLKITLHLVLTFFILSMFFGLAAINSIISYESSGLFSAVIARLLNDFIGTSGAIIFLFASIFIVIRSYFDLNFYDSIMKIFSKLFSRVGWIKKEQNIEVKKREHTEKLLEGLKNRRELEHVDIPNPIPASSSPLDFDKNTHEAIKGERSDSLPKNKLQEILPDKKVNSTLDDGNSINKTEKKIIEADKNSIEEYRIQDEIIEQEVNFDETVEVVQESYQLPSVDYLDHHEEISPSASDSELVEKAQFLTQSLSTFGVQGKVVNIAPGPVITLFEVEPAEGVRVNKFVQLSDDLARVMKAPRVRVIAPIPGKSSVGIEIPNENPSVVYMRSVVNSEKFISSKSNLVVALGKTTSGENFIIELDKLPHLLIAGTTGSGKSVCINTIISSLLYRSTPEEVRFILIDPKKLEMASYRSLEKHHLITSEDIDEYVVTTPENAVLALRAAEKEMGRRYDVLADAVVRNIQEFREKASKDNNLETMPYIVVIIDELADLMLRAPKEVEQSIARLAQMARAVGIHLVLATQRPSVDVITGVIKANFPARIAFQVATKIDSRTIIDINGAEKLLGKGDMLFLPPGSSDPTRLHNSFVTLDEITKIVGHIESQPTADEIKLEGSKSQIGPDGEINGTGIDDQDELLNEAIRLIVTNQQGSISLIQRRFRVGYSRAARLIDQMEQIGIVGPFTGSKAREVLVDESYLQILDDNS